MSKFTNPAIPSGPAHANPRRAFLLSVTLLGLSIGAYSCTAAHQPVTGPALTRPAITAMGPAAPKLPTPEEQAEALRAERLAQQARCAMAPSGCPPVMVNGPTWGKYGRQ